MQYFSRGKGDWTVYVLKTVPHLKPQINDWWANILSIKQQKSKFYQVTIPN